MADPVLICSAPVLQVTSVVTSVAFYVEKLGFTAGAMWGEPPVFCIVGRGAVTVFLDQSRDGAQPRNQFWAAYIYVDDIEALHAEFVSRGVEIARTPETMPYHCREFDVRDPDGHLIGFGQDLEPSPQRPGL